MYQGGTFHRKLWQNKPRQWGPRSRVQGNLFESVNRLGEDPSKIALAMPMWNPGDQVDYSKNGVTGTNSNVEFNRNNQVFIGSSTTFIDTPGDDIPSLGKTGSPVTSLMGLSLTLRYNRYFFAKNSSFGCRSNLHDLEFFVWGINATSTIQVPTDYSIHQVGGVFNGSDSVSCFYDGSNVKTTTGTSTSTTNTNVLRIGGRYGKASAEYMGGDGHYILVSSNILSPYSIASLYENPWQLWQPVAPVFYSFGTTISTGWPHNINGIANVNIGKVNWISLSNIAKINGVS